MVSANNTLAAFSESLGSNTIGSHCRKQGQDLREQYGCGSGELRVHALGKAEVDCRREQGVGVGGEGHNRFNKCARNFSNGSRGLGLTSMTAITIQPSAWTQLLFFCVLLDSRRRLAPTFEAASKHTKPMPKSTVSPMRWLSMMQAYVLHCGARE